MKNETVDPRNHPEFQNIIRKLSAMFTLTALDCALLLQKEGRSKSQSVSLVMSGLSCALVDGYDNLAEAEGVELTASMKDAFKDNLTNVVNKHLQSLYNLADGKLN